MDYQRLIVGIEQNIAKISLNLPKSRNALDLEIRLELIDLFMRLREDDQVKVIILTGVGEHFCAGADIRSLEKVGSTVAGRARLKKGHQLIKGMVEMEKPIIAQVDGFAAGAGVSLALASDLIVASDRAKFFFSFVKIGLAPDWGQYFLVPSRVGLARAKELFLNGEPITAQRAEEIGLINKVVPADNLAEEVWAWAVRLAKGPSLSHALIKSALNCWPMSLNNYLELEAHMQPVAFGSEDFQEGRRAFLEKRKPVFQGK